jgi:hypothetical protein
MIKITTCPKTKIDYLISIMTLKMDIEVNNRLYRTFGLTMSVEYLVQHINLISMRLDLFKNINDNIHNLIKDNNLINTFYYINEECGIGVYLKKLVIRDSQATVPIKYFLNYSLSHEGLLYVIHPNEVNMVMETCHFVFITLTKIYPYRCSNEKLNSIIEGLQPNMIANILVMLAWTKSVIDESILDKLMSKINIKTITMMMCHMPVDFMLLYYHPQVYVPYFGKYYKSYIPGILETYILPQSIKDELTKLI